MKQRETRACWLRGRWVVLWGVACWSILVIGCRQDDPCALACQKMITLSHQALPKSARKTPISRKMRNKLAAHEDRLQRRQLQTCRRQCRKGRFDARCIQKQKDLAGIRRCMTDARWLSERKRTPTKTRKTTAQSTTPEATRPRRALPTSRRASSPAVSSKRPTSRISSPNVRVVSPTQKRRPPSVVRSVAPALRVPSRPVPPTTRPAPSSRPSAASAPARR